MTPDENPTQQAPGSPTPARPSRGRMAAVLLIASACGWLVMEMEILGGRMLTPYFGSDTYVTWGSVIGVFLLGLSVGYALGGWLSAKPRSDVILGINLIVAGLWLCATPLVAGPVSTWVDERMTAGLDDYRLSLRLGALVTCVALFGIPMVALGTVSPTAVRWLTEEARTSGARAGTVLALSTVASFAGCIVTAWYLVLLDVRIVVWVSGGALTALGVAIAAVGRIRRPAGPAGAQTP